MSDFNIRSYRSSDKDLVYSICLKTGESGKDATFFITDEHPMEMTANPLEAYIMGKKVDLSDRQKMLYEKYKEKYRRKGRLD